MNFYSHKIIESAHVRIDEFVEKSEEERKKESEYYSRFIYYEPNTFPNLFERKETSSPESIKSPTVTELEEVQIELHSEEPESHSEATNLVQTNSGGLKPQTEGPKLEVEIHNEESGIHSKPKEPVLARYVRRHHAPDQTIEDKSEGTITRSKLKGTCLLAKLELRNFKDSLDNVSCVEEMNEEIK